MNLVMPVIVQKVSSDTVPRIITDHIQTEVNEAKTAPTQRSEAAKLVIREVRVPPLLSCFLDR